MSASKAAICLGIVMAAIGALPLSGASRPQGVSTREVDARTWVGRAAEIETYLRTARVVRTADTERGVTRPTRAFFEPGGPVESMTWKALPPGRSRGYFESYKSEIAAYEIDKMLGLNMVPPKVERELDGTIGVAVMWVEPTESFADLGGVPKVPPPKMEAWNRELIRAKMFHNLVGDIDPNLGNWLVDPAGHIILIDQSRAFTTNKKLVHEMGRIDEPLWLRMRALSDATLTRDLSAWLDRSQIKAVLERRDEMQKQIDRLVKEKGSAQVFVR
jgi:hypothetical protein